MELTEKQKKIYFIIKTYIEKNGYSPTVRDICKIAGVNSPATVQSHINHLKEKGYITYIPNMNRTIRIIKEV